MVGLHSGDEADILIAQVWRNLMETGEIENLVYGRAKTLAGFLEIFRVPGRAVAECDEELGIWFVGWVEPAFEGAFYCQWIHPNRRHGVAALTATLESMGHFLEKYPVLLGVTKQHRLVKEHVRLGYRKVGEIPLLWGPLTQLLCLTVDGFVAANQDRIARLRRRDMERRYYSGRERH